MAVTVTAPPVHNASSRAYLRNVVLSYAATVISLLAGLVVTPILYRRLGGHGFGVYSLVLSVAAFALLADLGVSTTTVRRVADAAARQDHDAVILAVRASRVLLRGSAALAFAAIAVVAMLAPAAFDLTGHDARDARIALLLIASGQAVLMAAGTTTSVVIGHGRADLFAMRSAALGLGTAAGQAVAALAGAGVVGVSAVVAASYVVSAGIGVRLQRRVLGGPVHRARVPRALLRDVLREGGANLGIAVFGTAAFASDTVVLGALAPLSAVAAYAVATRVPGLIRSVSSRAVDLLTPTVSHFNAADSSALLTVLSRATRLSTGTGIAAGLVVVPNLHWLFDLWLGNTPRHAVDAAVLLTIAMVLQLPTQAAIVFLTGLRRLRPLFWFVAVSAAANVVLTVLLTPHLGAVGPALASAACVAAGDLLVVPLLLAPAAGVRARTILNRITAPTLLPALPAVAVACVPLLVSGKGLSIAAGVGAGATYLGLFWAATGAVDRAWIRGLMRRRQTLNAAT